MKEKGFPLIESLMFDEHDMVKRAATECMCNMVLCEEVTTLFAFTRSLVNYDSVDKRGTLKSWLPWCSNKFSLLLLQGIYGAIEENFHVDCRALLGYLDAQANSPYCYNK